MCCAAFGCGYAIMGLHNNPLATNARAIGRCIQYEGYIAAFSYEVLEQSAPYLGWAGNPVMSRKKGRKEPSMPELSLVEILVLAAGTTLVAAFAMWLTVSYLDARDGRRRDKCSF